MPLRVYPSAYFSPEEKYLDHKSIYKEQDIIEGKIFAVMAYLSLLCVIPIILKKDNEFALFHAKQGLVLFIGEAAVFIGHMLLGEWFLRLGIFVLGSFALVGMIAALQGKAITLPIVCDIAENITL